MVSPSTSRGHGLVMNLAFSGRKPAGKTGCPETIITGRSGLVDQIVLASPSPSAVPRVFRSVMTRSNG